MKKKVKLDPFTYSKIDLFTSFIQIAAAAAGVILAMNGQTAGLLALGALAGGRKGTLVADLFRKLAEDASVKKSGGFVRLPLLVLILSVSLLFASCGIDKQFLVDSHKAILTEAGDYLQGCKQATIAPAFSVDWEERVTYGGGIFAGCEANGKLMQFQCEGFRDEETGKVRMKCEPLSLWEQHKE